MGQCLLMGPNFYKRLLTSLDLKEKVVNVGEGWQVSGRSTDSLDFLLSK